jgi:anti-sigma B factor antagonist
VPASEYPFQMIGRVPVLTAPAQIDITTSSALRAILSQWHSRGHTTVVVDLTGTSYCDMAGLHELARAHKRAAAAGGGLRLVTRADGAFARIFCLSQLDASIPHFATVGQALAQLPAATGPLRQDPAREPAAAAPRRRCAAQVAQSAFCSRPNR